MPRDTGEPDPTDTEPTCTKLTAVTLPWALCATCALKTETNTTAEGQTSVHVTIDAVRAIEELIALMSTFPYRDVYLDSLVRARTAFETQSPSLGVAALEDFRATVLAVLQPMVFSAPLVNLLLGKVDRVLACAGDSPAQPHLRQSSTGVGTMVR